MKTYGNVDSKFRFVIIAAKRAKQLLKGSKPRLKAKTKNLIRIAQNEIKMGLVDYEIIPLKKDETSELEERLLEAEDDEEVQEEDDEESTDDMKSEDDEDEKDEEEEEGTEEDMVSDADEIEEEDKQD